MPLLFFFFFGATNFFLPGLASNCDPSDLCLLSYWDNRHQPSCPAKSLLLTFVALNVSLSLLVWFMLMKGLCTWVLVVGVVGWFLLVVLTWPQWEDSLGDLWKGRPMLTAGSTFGFLGYEAVSGGNNWSYFQCCFPFLCPYCQWLLWQFGGTSSCACPGQRMMIVMTVIANTH
jgi:hypothetical protein